MIREKLRLGAELVVGEAAGCGMAEGFLEHCNESGDRRDALGNQSRSRSSRLNGVTG